MTEDLRKRVRTKREKNSVSLRVVIETATSESLPKLVAQLKGLHLGFDGKRRPARLPMTDATIGCLKVASKQTGIPASRLLLASLSLTCKGGK
jgi:hypothetical protein